MKSSGSEHRHLTVGHLDQLWTRGFAFALPIPGQPACHVEGDPARQSITLVTPYEMPEPPVERWRNITLATTSSDKGDLAELTVQIDENLHGAYGLLTTIADQLQLHRVCLADAVTTAVTKHRNMFVGRSALTPEREIGLCGELDLAVYLIGQVGPQAAIDAWQGPLGEEHDFVLANVHVEVKTTASERRLHWIHGLTQLMPVELIPLKLVSIQVTRSTAARGRTLGQRVGAVRAAAGGSRAAVDERLAQAGWRDDDRELYTTFWAPRSKPRAYCVDDQFPALTAGSLASLPNRQAVSDVSYRVDLDGFAGCTLADPLAGFVDDPKERT